MNGNMNSRLLHPLTRLHCLLIVLAALAVVVLADGVVSAAPRQQTPSNVATLSSLSLSDVTLAPAFASGTLMYTATVAHTVAETTVTATPTDSNATVVVNGFNFATFLPVTYADGTVPLNYGDDNRITVVVTAEDGTATETYVITVTRARPIGSRSFSPSTVAPGGTVRVTITYGDYGRLGGQTLETLPAGFSWVFVSSANLPSGITAVLDPMNSQILDIIMLGQVDRIHV